MVDYIFCIFKVFRRVSIERQIKDSPAGLFLQNEYFIVMLAMCHAKLQFHIVK